jgi:dolichyl-phosphate beta-glucosyltransferase
MAKSPEISIIIPAYNEEKVIAETIKKITAFFRERDYEIIIVDDGSTDNTLLKVQELNYPNIKLIRNYKNYGKGYSVKRGMLHSKGREVLFTDVDLSTPLEDYEKLKREIENDSDLAIGSRLLSGSTIIKRQPIIRELLGKFYGIFAHYLVRWKFVDTQCGFKLFKGDAARDIFGEVGVKGYGFDIEVILIALKKGYKITEVPVRWVDNPDSKIKFFSLVYFYVLRDLVMIFLKKLKGIY